MGACARKSVHLALSAAAQAPGAVENSVVEADPKRREQLVEGRDVGAARHCDPVGARVVVEKRGLVDGVLGVPVGHHDEAEAELPHVELEFRDLFG